MRDVILGWNKFDSQKQSNRYESPRSAWKSFSILCFYIIYLLIATLHPFEFSTRSSGSLTDYLETFLNPLPGGPRQLLSRDFVYNFIFLIPCGFLFQHFYVTLRKKRSWCTLLLAGASGAALSFLIELTQVFIPGRLASAKDVLANTGGTFCGALIFALCPTGISRALWRIATSKKVLAIVCLLGSWPTLVWMVRYPWFHFDNWNSSFALRVGNHDPAWIGRIYWAAIYDRALSENEVRNHFQGDHLKTGLARSFSPKPVVLYVFSEARGNTIHDQSGYGPALDLDFEDGSEFRLLSEPSGVEFMRPSSLISKGSPKKLLDALRASNELSIELWLSPPVNTEKERVNILSFSPDDQRANFAIDQIGTSLAFRLRTPSTGLDGRKGNLRILAPIPPSNVVHLLTTYRNAVEKLFLNGALCSDTVDLTWSTVIGLAAKNLPPAQTAYALCYFFPAALLLAMSAQAKYESLLRCWAFGLAISSSFLVLPELLRLVLLGRNLDWSLLACGTAAESIGAILGVYTLKLQMS